MTVALKIENLSNRDETVIIKRDGGKHVIELPAGKYTSQGFAPGGSMTLDFWVDQGPVPEAAPERNPDHPDPEYVEDV